MILVEGFGLNCKLVLKIWEKAFLRQNQINYLNHYSTFFYERELVEFFYEHELVELINAIMISFNRAVIVYSHIIPLFWCLTFDIFFVTQ